MPDEGCLNIKAAVTNASLLSVETADGSAELHALFTSSPLCVGGLCKNVLFSHYVTQLLKSTFFDFDVEARSMAISMISSSQSCLLCFISSAVCTLFLSLQDYACI